LPRIICGALDNLPVTRAGSPDMRPGRAWGLAIIVEIVKLFRRRIGQWCVRPFVNGRAIAPAAANLGGDEFANGAEPIFHVENVFFAVSWQHLPMLVLFQLHQQPGGLIKIGLKGMDILGEDAKRIESAILS